MHQQRLGRVAHAHPLAFRVHGQPLGHLGIGRAIDVDVAIAGKMLDDRHAGFFAHAADEALAAAGNGHVDRLGHAEQLAHGGAIGRGDQLHGVGRQPGLGGGRGQQIGDRAIRVGRFLAAAKDDGIAALDADRRRVGGHVGPRFVDEEDHAQGDADLLYFQAVGPNRRGDDFADGLRQHGDFFQGRGHGLNPRGGQAEAIDGGGGQAKAGRGLQVVLVGFQQRGRTLDESLARRAEPGLFLRPGDDRQVGGGPFGPGRYFQAIRMQIIHGGSIPRMSVDVNGDLA